VKNSGLFDVKREGEDITGCTGYLEHPFQNKPFEKEKNRHCLLVNRGGAVYNPKSSPASSRLNDTMLM
jgi:hypothetical protein